MTELHNELMYPGHGFPEHMSQGRSGGRESPQTLYAMLAAGRPLGKRAAVQMQVFGRAANSVNQQNQILDVRGPDEAAMNLNICLAPPKFVATSALGGGGTISNAAAADMLQRQAPSGTFANSADDGTPVQPGANANNFNWSPLIARLEWGIGGVSNEHVEADFMNGVCINVSASYLRLFAIVDPYIFNVGGSTVAFAGDAALYELAAFVGPGWTKPKNAQRTIPLPAIPATAGGNPAQNASPILPIPRYATKLRLLAMQPARGTTGTPVIGSTAQVVFYSSPGSGNVLAPALNPNAVGSSIWVDNGAQSDIPIPNGAYFFNVFNLIGGGINLDVLAIFDLSI